MAALCCLLLIMQLSLIASQGDLPCTVNGQNIPDYVCERGNFYFLYL